MLQSSSLSGRDSARHRPRSPNPNLSVLAEGRCCRIGSTAVRVSQIRSVAGSVKARHVLANAHHVERSSMHRNTSRRMSSTQRHRCMVFLDEVTIQVYIGTSWSSMLLAGGFWAHHRKGYHTPVEWRRNHPVPFHSCSIGSIGPPANENYERHIPRL